MIGALVASTAILSGGVFAATFASSAKALPASFASAQAALASDRFNIQVSPLPDASSAAVTEQQAEAIALHGIPASEGVTATLVSATDAGGDDTVAADGTLSPVISDRTAWLVLIPGRQVPIVYPMGKSGPPSHPATIAVLIDADSGDFLLGAALPT